MLCPDSIRFTKTVEQSKAVNQLSGFFIVIAASGMCDAGCIRHHLKANLWRHNATIMMAGHRAQGRPGASSTARASDVKRSTAKRELRSLIAIPVTPTRQNSFFG